VYRNLNQRDRAGQPGVERIQIFSSESEQTPQIATL
jgi:hypothetical protein